MRWQTCLMFRSIVTFEVLEEFQQMMAAQDFIAVAAGRGKPPADQGIREKRPRAWCTVDARRRDEFSAHDSLKKLIQETGQIPGWRAFPDHPLILDISMQSRPRAADETGAGAARRLRATPGDLGSFLRRSREFPRAESPFAGVADQSRSAGTASETLPN